jgi:phosphatidylglycerophosphate synthase
VQVHTGPLVGLFGQLALLAVLDTVVGLDATGWLAGTAWGVVTAVALSRGLTRAGHVALGPANRVTLLRATLVGGVTALVGTSAVGSGRDAVLVGLAAVALVLDGVDGKVARRTGTVSTLGARFDMEVDAFLILVLSVDVARSYGLAVLAIGAARYAIWVAPWAVRWMRRPVLPRYWRKPVAAIQGIVLTAAVADLLPRTATMVVIAVAMLLLAESFGRDVVWQWRRRGDPGPGGTRRAEIATTTSTALPASTASRG